MKGNILKAEQTNSSDAITGTGTTVAYERSVILRLIAEDLDSIPGHTHRVTRTKLIRNSLACCKTDITPLQWEIIRLLEEEGTLHCAEIAGRLQIARAQITKLVNKLVVLKLTERRIDNQDRRITNVCLTCYGKDFLFKNKNDILNAIETSLSGLTDRELEDFSLSLRNIHSTLYRME